MRAQVLAFCFDAAVARRLQLHRGVHPILLDACALDSNPYAQGTSMSALRAESVRTCGPESAEAGLLAARLAEARSRRDAGHPLSLRIRDLEGKVAKKEAQVKAAGEYIEDGNTDIKYAIQYQKEIRQKYCCLIIIILIIVLVIAAALGLFTPKDSD